MLKLRRLPTDSLPRTYQEEAAYGIVKPIRLDDAKLAGLSPTVSYLDARPGHLYSDPSRLVPLKLHR